MSRIWPSIYNRCRNIIAFILQVLDVLQQLRKKRKLRQNSVVVLQIVFPIFAS